MAGGIERDPAEYGLDRLVDLLGEIWSWTSCALWLLEPNAELDKQRPIDLCQTDEGRLRVVELVEGMLPDWPAADPF